MKIPEFDHNKLVRCILDEPWHNDCEIIVDYMPPFPNPDTKPTIQVKYNDGSEYPPHLRYSRGPKQGFFWDIYGEDMYSVELAIVAISQAPAPINCCPIEFKIPIRMGMKEPEGCDICGENPSEKTT